MTVEIYVVNFVSDTPQVIETELVPGVYDLVVSVGVSESNAGSETPRTLTVRLDNHGVIYQDTLLGESGSRQYYRIESVAGKQLTKRQTLSAVLDGSFGGEVNVEVWLTYERLR